MALNTAAQALISFKKLFNRAHTSPNNTLLANENLPVGFSTSASQVFAETIPSNPLVLTPALGTISGPIERIRLPLTFIPGTTSILGQHGYFASLPANYQTTSLNPNKGTGVWANNQSLNLTLGAIQIIPVSLGGADYRPILLTGGLAEITPLDSRNWILYEFGGVIYQDAPVIVGASPLNPAFLDCWIYIGRMVSDILASGTYIHYQTAPSAVWTIHHNLNKFGSVSIVDGSNQAVIADYVYDSQNTVTVTFAQPQIGKVFLS